MKPRRRPLTVKVPAPPAEEVTVEVELPMKPVEEELGKELVDLRMREMLGGT